MPSAGMHASKDTLNGDKFSITVAERMRRRCKWFAACVRGIVHACMFAPPVKSAVEVSTPCRGSTHPHARWLARKRHVCCPQKRGALIRKGAAQCCWEYAPTNRDEWKQSRLVLSSLVKGSTPQQWVTSVLSKIQDRSWMESSPSYRFQMNLTKIFWRENTRTIFHEVVAAVPLLTKSNRKL